MSGEEPGAPLRRPDADAMARARERQSRLTKPAGSLGVLEELAVRLAGLQGADRPRADRAAAVVFAADHGVAEEGVSAFPPSVTGDMVRNFAGGGAAICALARALGVRLDVVHLGTVNDPGRLDGVRREFIAPRTANFTKEPAMTLDQYRRAMDAGRDALRRAKEGGVDVFIGGEMGIGNTTAAAALACAFLGERPERLAGPGTGLDPVGVARKVDVLRRALALHGGDLSAEERLRRLGGFEIVALVGAYVAAAREGVPVLVDGYICSAAALAAERLRPGAAEWMIFAHASAEPGHGRMLEALGARPLLNLGMRLGEASGAAVALPILRLACALHNNMATFSEAGVEEKLP